MPTRKMMLLATVLSGGPADTTAPTVTITSTETSPSPVLPVPIAFSLSEVATDFAVGDLTLNGCTVASFAGSGAAYTCQATPTTPNATFTIDIAANAFHDATGNGNAAATQFSFTSSAYLLVDQYTTDRAAGAVNTTTAEPGGSGSAGQKTRTTVETDGQYTISGGRLVFPAQTTPTWGDQALHYGAITRALGKIIACDFNWQTISNFGFGVSSSATIGTPSGFDAGIDINTGALGSRDLYGTLYAVPVATGTTYTIYVVLRASGAWFFIKGGAYTYPTLLMVHSNASTAALYPALGTFSSAGSADDFVVTNNTYIPAPVCYDTFTRANAVLGNSETTGPDSQTVTARAWTDTAGTWGVATNKAACSALTGSGFATIPGTSADVLAEVALTRAAGVGGMVLRYVDANNYLIAYHDGTNVKLDKVVAGVTTNLLSAAVAYADGRILRARVSGTAARVYYHTTVVSAEGTVPASVSTTHGLYTTDTSNTFDGFTLWNIGTANEYGTLSNYADPVPSNLLIVGDSKSAVGMTEWPGLLLHSLYNAGENWMTKPAPIQNGGWNYANVQTWMDANLAGVTDTPEVILYNLGSNSPDMVEASAKAAIGANLDSLHAKWPNVPIYLARPWYRTHDAYYLSLATWIGEIVTARSSYCHLGHNENVWMKAADDGAVMSSDGIHYSAAGHAECAAQWLAILTA